MQWKKIAAPVGFAIAAAFAFVSVASADPNQANEKFDVRTSAHFDTTFASAPSDTVLFGFLADNVSVCVPATSAAVVTWFGGTATGTGSPPTIRSNSGGIFGNTRLGRPTFTSTAFTPPASSCYTYYGPALCRGVIITGTWTGTVNLIADRIGK
jgi:hypothetical protein